MIWQVPQYLIPARSSLSETVSNSVCSFGCLSKCITRRRADFLPIPGNFDISSTACPTNFEVYSIYSIAALIPAPEIASRIGFNSLNVPFLT